MYCTFYNDVCTERDPYHHYVPGCPCGSQNKALAPITPLWES